MSHIIEIKMFATLSAYLPPSADRYAVEPGTSVKDLLSQLKVPEEKAKLIFINGSRAKMDAQLNHGDRVGIFPPVGGG